MRKKKVFKTIDKYGMDHTGIPCLDLYCMNLAFEIARKSRDPDTKHGCFAIGEDGEMVSAGYNGPPQGAADDEIPTTRPEKYIYFEHSERNCIYLASRTQTSLKGSTFYITGFPCSECTRGMIQAKIKKIIYGPYNSVMTKGGEYLKRYSLLLKNQEIIIERFKYDEGLYKFNPRVKKLVAEKEMADISFEWNK